ncbi:DUF2281 domain-containing protein [Candidatus Methylobacter oryzae]|uniref:DUF2281 domain-containing protein n=1 Tax=Candidatus Methylobacter oryzae TaxID=2497749 RepID=UPI0018AD550D|nr:DUF2281 domain-containing protein [Candidatus Methylobacter oryzae]
MTLAETIYQHSLNLPDAAAREALDFIEFLEQRYNPIPVITNQQSDSEAFLAALSSNLDNNITDEDLETALRLSAVVQPEAKNEVERQTALAYLNTVRIDWNGKPIPNRDELYDDARG